MPQQMGGTIPGLNLPFGAQPSLQIPEDPSLYVNFDDEETDFSMARRIPVSYPQQAQRRPATALAEPTRSLPTPTGAASLPQSRPASAGAAKPVSAADKELAELKRRIAEKEQQMKAKRQSAQSSAAANLTKFNPAHGPVLRGLHRKQSPVPENSSEQQIDLFLKEVAADLPAKPSGASAASQDCDWPVVLLALFKLEHFYVDKHNSPTWSRLNFASSAFHSGIPFALTAEHSTLCCEHAWVILHCDTWMCRQSSSVGTCQASAIWTNQGSIKSPSTTTCTGSQAG